jgi:hypothetical protein
MMYGYDGPICFTCNTPTEGKRCIDCDFNFCPDWARMAGAVGAVRSTGSTRRASVRRRLRMPARWNWND